MLTLFLLACAGPTRPVVGPTESPCAAGETLDGETCAPDACGTGAWGSLPVDTDTVFVDASAPDGGDGTEASPFRLLQDAVDVAGERGGALVAMAAGTYLEICLSGCLM